MFYSLFIFYVKSIINYSTKYLADCVSCILRLTLLDLTNKLDLGLRSQNGTHSYVRGLTI